VWLGDHSIFVGEAFFVLESSVVSVVSELLLLVEVEVEVEEVEVEVVVIVVVAMVVSDFFSTED
jgi:hypothetical protein